MAVVGIDLGTTNTVVACVRNGRVHVLPDEKGRRLLPSVVSFHPNGDVLVGYPAKERRIVDAKNTVASIKRVIGRAWGSEEIKRAQPRFPFAMKEGPGQGALIVARGQEYTLPEISAFVLRRAKEIAERALGEAVERAVVTVPANFNELQRAATKVAGRVAGLDVLRIINEPTAAALAYGLGRAAKERIAIYDFGGGTFDCTLLDLAGNVFEVLATAGDSFLGGDDLDVAIADRMADAFLRAHRYDARSDGQAYERLRVAAEALKIELSSRDRAQSQLRELAFGVGGAHLDLDFGMARDELEVLATPLVERTFAVCQESLGVARLPVSAFDKVILVGGSTRVPLVRRRVEQFFGSPPLDRVNPEEVVAIGAAIQAAALTEVARRKSIPNPPLPAARKSYASLPPSTDMDDEREVTVATKVTALMAEQERQSRPAFPIDVLPPHDASRTTRLGPPPLPVPAKTARMPSAPALPGEAKRLAATQVLGSPASPPPVIHDPSATLPRPVSFEDVLRAERAEAPAARTPSLDVRGASPSSSQEARLPALHSGSLGSAQPLTPPGRPAAPPPPADDGETPAYLPPTAIVMPSAATPTRTAILAAPAAQPSVSVPTPAIASMPSPVPVSPATTLPLGQALPPSTPPPVAPSAPPVLVDVTPRALVVETVGGWCDVVVQRNAKIPCERTRAFATSSDKQTMVRVRVAQGEDSMFGANTYLGEVELAGLRAAARGEVTILVRFEVDESGTLRVSAIDASTGRAAQATLQLVGIAAAHSIPAMAARHSAARLRS